MKIYLSGPMSGLPGLNFPTFAAEAKRLRELGHVVFNPAEMEDTGRTWAAWIMLDLAILKAGSFDVLALLPGWERSKGCAVEVAFARGIELEIKNTEELT